MESLDKLHHEGQRQGLEYSKRILESYESFWHSEHWDFTRREKAQWMLRQIAKRNPQYLRALEIGCGIGFTTFEVAQSSFIQRICAVDTSDLAIREARILHQSQPPDIRRKIAFELQNFFDIKEEEHYDLIYMHEVIEHIPDTEAVFKQACMLLRPKGCFMISTPNYNRSSNRLRALFGRRCKFIDPYHIREFTLKELMSPPEGWMVQAVTGRILLDEVIFRQLLSLGIPCLSKPVRPMARWLAQSRPNYLAGQMLPQHSGELYILYSKK